MNSLLQAEREKYKKNNVDCTFKHLKLQAPISNKQRCDDCDSYVEVKDKKYCNCCSHIIVKKKKNEWLQRVINEGMQDVKILKRVEEFKLIPTKNVPHAVINYRGFVYEIPIKWLVISQELYEVDKHLMLELVREKTVVKGITREVLKQDVI